MNYIAATPYGMPEEVLLEILRSDEKLVKSFEVSKFWSEIDEKIPEIVWSRLYHDLEPFLSRRSFYGEEYLDFYHAQFRRVVTDIKKPWVDEKVMLGCKKVIEDLAGSWTEEQLPTLCTFLFRHSIESAVSSTNKEIVNKAIERLCDFGYLMHRMERTQGEENLLEMDYDRLILSSTPKGKDLIQKWNQWKLFFKSKRHCFGQSNETWPSYKMLLQLASESVYENIVKQAIQRQLRCLVSDN